MSKLRESVTLSTNGSAWHRYTCTVEELIIHLSKYPKDTPILAEWEGTLHGITTPELQSKESHKFDSIDNALVFNVDI
jgi:hypothetical protein